jgi:hypothetical protein
MKVRQILIAVPIMGLNVAGCRRPAHEDEKPHRKDILQ